MEELIDRNAENGLERKLGLFPLTNIVIANMIGAGIFTTSGLLMENLRHPLILLLLWVAGGIVALCGALSYGELGAAFPHAGGEYLFLSRLFHPLLGFLSGWVSFFVGFSAPIAASAIGFSEYFTRGFPQILTWGEVTVLLNPGLLKKIYAVLIIVIFTLIHIRGIELGSRVQNVLTLIKIGLILSLIILGFASEKGNWAHFSQAESSAFGFKSLKIWGLSLMWIMFAYSGWNASAYVGSEIKSPAKNLPLSLLLGTGIVTLLYLGLNLFYVYAISPENMRGVISVGGLAVGNLFGKSWESFFSLLISFALFSSLSAFIILGPRVYYSMAKDGYFFKFVSHIHPLFRVPAKSVLLQGLVAAIIVLSGSFEQILTYMGFSLGIFPILAVVGVFKLRHKSQSIFKMPGFPFVPAIYILAGISILFLGFLQSPVPSSIAILTVLVGIPAYFLFKSFSNR